MLKKNKFELDEMHEQKLARIEHNTMIILGAGLVLAMVFQQVAYLDFKFYAPECIIILIGALYYLIACIKNGIWAKKRNKPSLKQMTLWSVVGGTVFALVWGIAIYARYGSLLDAFVVFLFVLICLSALLMATYLALGKIFNKMQRKADEDADKEELGD